MRIVSTLLIASMLVCGAPSQSAQSSEDQASKAEAPKAAPAKAGPIPRLANGKPNLSGHWAEPFTPNMAVKDKAGKSTVLDPKTHQPLAFPRMGEALPDAKPSAFGDGKRTFDLPFTEWGLKRWKEYDPVNNGDYAGSCLPFGFSRLINSPHGLQIVQSDDAIAFLFEQNTWHHWVPTNGMKWPEDLPPTWSGLSLGHWEGDTLVIETRGFNGYTWLDTAGHPQSKDLVLTNTFRRTDADTIVHTVTVHDPKAYTRDWMNERIWKIRKYPDVLMEYSCEENNLDNLLNGTIKRWKPPEDEN